MRKKLLYLVAMIGSFAFTTNAQDCDTLALTVGGGSYASEITWDITADSTTFVSGAGETSESVCLGAGAYSFNMYDSYGDGWNGNEFTLSSGDDIIATGGLDAGSEGSVDFVYGDVSVAGCTDATALNYNELANEDDGSCIAVVEGCMDATANNYNADANVDDGSCTYPYACAEGELLLSMVDSYGDSWNGSELVINDLSYTVAVGSNAEGCVADGCLIVSTIEGSYMSEASWTLTNEAGDDIAAGGLPFNGTIGECSIQGCMDAEALNYDANATEDDGSCEYYSCDATELAITMSDSYGDGWNGNVLTIGDESFTIESGSEGAAVICLADGVYAVTNGGGSFGSEVSWSIGDVLSGGSPFEGTLVIGDVAITGCTDSLAINFNPDATEDDASCEYCEGTIITMGGGTYIEETSYTIANCDGSVIFSAAGEAGEYCIVLPADYSITMDDSYGDGWNGNILNVGGVEYTVEGSSNYVELGSCGVYGCMDSIAYNFNADATIDDGSCEAVAYGCIDPIAENYNADANTDDMSCTYIPGCTDPTAVNYTPSASEDDGSCQYVSCLETEALLTFTMGSYATETSLSIIDANGQELAFIAGSGLSGDVYTNDLCLSDANSYTAILMDSYGDGWNGGTFSISTCEGTLVAASGTIDNNLEDVGNNDTLVEIAFSIQACDSYVFGCMDSIASNYDASATADDGLCSYPGCTDAAYLEFDEGANTDDGSCVTLVVEGCIDETALNVNPEANTDDGSCEFAITCDEGLSGISVSMVDSYGDGWNGNILSLSNTSGEVVASGTIDAGTDSTITVCVAPGCYNITVDGGAWQTEVSWSIATTQGGAAALEGGAPSVSYLSIGSDDSCSEDNFAVGCMDPWASNYDADATSAGECDYPINADCDMPAGMLFDNQYSGSSLVNQWFTFTTESSDVVLSSVYTDPYSDVEFFSTVLDSCGGDTLTGALDAGTYIVHVNNNYGTSYNIDYTAVWNLAAAVEGCMDSYATNYDTLANVAGECLYECEGVSATLTVTTSELYANENAFDLLSGEGEIVASGGFVDAFANGAVVEIPLCLQSGLTYTMNTYDSYGDGWTGYGADGGYSITYDCDSTVVVASSNSGMNDPASVAVDGYHLESSDEFTLIACSDLAFGCMDEVADNYDASANMDDGSCYYLGCTDMNFVEYDPTATVDDGSCVTPSCGDGTELVSITVGGGSYDVEISWSITDCDGIEIISGLAPFAIDTCLALPEGYVVNMVDSYGDGWNGALLTLNGDEYGLDSGSEGAVVVGECGGYGCTNPDAANYDMDATDDDGSCEFECPLNASGEVYNVTVDTAGLTILNCYYYIWESQYDYTIEEIEGYGYDCSCVEAPVLGCMDMEADNYDPLATQNAGCEYTVLCDEGQQQVMVTMIDSWGDGWNGNVLTIMSEDSVASMDYTIEAGAYGTADACIDMSGCNTITVDGGLYQTEVSWTITDLDGATLAEGGAPASVFVGTCYIDGCTDESALNYDPVATVDDGTCIAIVEGCMNDAYAEYNFDANVDDGSCATLLCAGNVVSLSVGGGTYDSEISWTLGENTGVAGDYDLCLEDGCFEFMMVDSYGDGWNGAVAVFTMDGVELLTATIESGDSGMALVSINGDCGLLGCTDASATNYNADATTDDGSCYYEGCTDPSADNFEETATIDDGSCMYSCPEGTGQVDVLVSTDNYAGETGFSLTDGTATYSVEFTGDNNNSTVTSTFCIENGSNVTFTLTDSYGDGIINGGYQIYVCEESVITNFSFSDYSVVEEFMVVCGEIAGCMDADALNYNDLATVSDDSCIYPFVCDDVAAQVTINTVAFGGEMGWSISDADGNEVTGEAGMYEDNSEYIIDICLVEGADYNFNMSDSYGDGWNGGTFAVNADCGELAAGGLETGAEGSIAFTACGGSTGCEVPASWTVAVTGANHTVMVPGSASVTVDDVQVANGSAIGIFFTNSNGDLQCAGYTTITGETAQIAAMGDDTTTEEVDGLVAGEAFMWMIWDGTTCTEVAATAVYTGGADVYTTNAITFVESIASVPAGPSCQTIDLPTGWSMFSTYMITADMTMMNVVSPIVDNVIIAKDNDGNAYLVEWMYDGIGELSVGQGYQIKTDADVSLELCGDYAFPEDNSVALSAGWNMIGYLRTEPADAAAVLADINDAGNLTIAKDYSGNAYLPEWNYNGIGDMVPGQGYQLKTIEVDVLTFLSNDESYRTSSIEVSKSNVAHFETVAATDNNMTVVIEDAAWDVLPTAGAEVAAFDKAGNLIGSAVYASPLTVLTVWGDDATTATKDGLALAENVSFKVWSNNTTNTFEVSNWVEGSASYDVNAINVANAIVTNVLADVIAAERELVKVVNVLGQEVILNEESFKGEVLFNVYNDGTVEKVVK